MMQHFLLAIALLGAAVCLLSAPRTSNLRNGARRAATGFEFIDHPDIEFPDACTCDAETISSELSLAIGQSDSPRTNPGSLKPGCYESTAAFMLTSTLTLNGTGDGTGNSNGTFIFRTMAALDTAAGSEVILTEGTDSKNVFWCIKAAVTMGALTNFQGDVYAGAAITVGANVNIGNLMSGAATTLGANVNVHGNLEAGAAVTLGANACIEGKIATGAGMTTGAGQRSAYTADWTDYASDATNTGVDAYPLVGKDQFVDECSDAADTVQLWAADTGKLPKGK